MNEGMSKEKIQQLLKAVGSRPQTDDTAVECTDFNWHEPHYFSKDQLAKLNTFTQKAASVLSEKFSVLCRSRFEVEITSTSQHYAGEIYKETGEGKKNYYLSFGSSDGDEFGLLEFPEQTAIFWAKQILGDSDTKEEARELSQLEESLLYDFASALVKALSGANSKCDYHPSHNIVSGQWPVKLQETEEICMISFSVKEAGSDAKLNASLLIPCSRLEDVVGKNKFSQDESSAQNYSNTILEHLGDTPVSVTAQLASTELSFEEMMNLQADDIIVLDKQIDEPVELIVEGRTVAYGTPGKSEGLYAITIETTDF